MIIKEISAISSGITFRSRMEATDTGNVRVIQMKDLGADNLVHLDRTTRIHHKPPKPAQLACSGDIIFRSRGRTYTGALLDEDAPDAIVAAPLFRIRPDTERVLPAYLLWWINQPLSQAYLNSRSKGTLLQMIDKHDLEYLDITLPPLAQQARIAELFRLSMREQYLLDEIKKNRETYIRGVLMRMASEPH